MSLVDPHGRPLRSDALPLTDPLDGYNPAAARAPSAEFMSDLQSEIERAVSRMDANVNLDAFANELTGIGTTWGDKSRGGMPGGPAFLLHRLAGIEAEMRTRGSDLGRNIVEKIPDEMTREGWDVEVQPDDADDASAEDAPPPTSTLAAADAARAAAGWRRAARNGTNGAVQRANDAARRWDAVAVGALPVEAAPPPPPGPLPALNDEGIELAEAIEAWADEVDVVGAVNQALRYEREFGGGAVLIGVDDGVDDLTQPLDPKRVRAVTHLTPLSGGWDGECIMWRPYNDPRRPKYGLPEIYQVRNTNVQLARPPAPGETRPVQQVIPFGPTGPTLFYVHESRFLVFDGEPVSRQARQEMRGWGDSVFTRVNEPLAQYEQTWNAVAILMTEYSVSTLAIKGLTRALTEKGSAAARAAFLEYARFQAITQSVARARFIDSEEKLERTNATISGIAELLQQWGVRLAAAADMPLSLLFGQTQGGLGDAGNTDLRWFYDRVKSKQMRRLLPHLRRLYSIAWRAKNSPTRGVEPARWSINFRPLWQPTALENADLRLKTTQADQIEITTQVTTPEEVTATRYGGADYNPGPIVIDAKGRTAARAFDKQEAARTAQKAAENPIAAPGPASGAAGRGAGASSVKVPPLTSMPSDPITGAPQSTPSNVGLDGARADDDWVTLNGAHVLLGSGGEAESGSAAGKKVGAGGGGGATSSPAPKPPAKVAPHPPTPHPPTAAPTAPAKAEAIKDPDKWGEKHFGEWEKNLSADHRAALEHYAGDGFKDINSTLRSSKGATVSKQVRTIDAAIASSPGAPHDFKVVRAMRTGPGLDPSQFKAGGTFSDHAFMSSAIGEARFSGDLRVHITVPKGSKGAFVGDSLQSFKGEKEWLMPRNTKLRIDKVVTKKGIFGPTYEVHASVAE